MKREMDLIRQLLFLFEAKNDTTAIEPTELTVAGYSSDEIAYNVTLMCEAGLLSHERIESNSTASRLINALPFRLTWEGHEFLDAARSESVWERAKDTIQTQGLSVTFAFVYALLLSYGKRQLGLE